jgi:TATA-box binding protein (TBP) (component of TFIID and TFIIIB)
MYVNVSTKKKKPVNIKLFCDGAIQMTGCKTIDHSIEVLTKVLFELKKTKAIIDYKTMTVVEKPFVTNADILTIKDVTNLRIAMINSGFKIPFRVDRGKLYNLLLESNFECLFDPAKHACVNIKCEHPDKTISIFVFEKGSIIITGAQNCDQIFTAYDFINKYLLKNHQHIKKNDILTNSNIIKYLDPKDVIDTDMSSSDESS